MSSTVVFLTLLLLSASSYAAELEEASPELLNETRQEEAVLEEVGRSSGGSPAFASYSGGTGYGGQTLAVPAPVPLTGSHVVLPSPPEPKQYTNDFATGLAPGLGGGSGFGVSSSHGSPSSSYGVPSSGYGVPSSSYGAPSSSYGAPSTSYGAPSSSYGVPSSSYGAPSSSYGAPSSSYGAPSSSYIESEDDDEEEKGKVGLIIAVSVLGGLLLLLLPGYKLLVLLAKALGLTTLASLISAGTITIPAIGKEAASFRAMDWSNGTAFEGLLKLLTDEEIWKKLETLTENY